LLANPRVIVRLGAEISVHRILEDIGGCGWKYKVRHRAIRSAHGNIGVVIEGATPNAQRSSRARKISDMSGNPAIGAILTSILIIKGHGLPAEFIGLVPPISSGGAVGVTPHRHINDASGIPINRAVRRTILHIVRGVISSNELRHEKHLRNEAIVSLP